MIFLNITIITHTTLHVVMSRNIFFFCQQPKIWLFVIILFNLSNPNPDLYAFSVFTVVLETSSHQSWRPTISYRW